MVLVYDSCIPNSQTALHQDIESFSEAEPAPITDEENQTKEYSGPFERRFRPDHDIYEPELRFLKDCSES